MVSPQRSYYDWKLLVLPENSSICRIIDLLQLSLARALTSATI
jgi:hypothetical protein